MIPLLIHATAKNSGKTLLALGMGLKFRADGYTLGYLKPVGWIPEQIHGEIADRDAIFMKKALDLKEPLEEICPVVMTQDMIQSSYEGQGQDVAKKILDTFRSVHQSKDILIVEGAGSLFEGAFIGARGIELAAALDAKILLANLYRDGIATIDSLLDVKELVGDRLVGGVINRVRSDKIEFVRKRVLRFLKEQEIDILGVIPEDKILGAVSVRHLAEMLSGSVICREDALLDEWVEGFMVGAMSPENALRFFQRQKNIAVITGGDRSDIQLAALEASVRGIVLTGGFHPHDVIVARAEERSIPLILVDQDTFSVVEHFGSMREGVGLYGEKIERAKQVVEQEIDFPVLYQKMGFS
jgi:hypothetical protein